MAEVAQEAASNVAEVAQGAATAVAAAAQDAAEQAQNAAADAKRQIDLARYRPVKPGELESQPGGMPRMIVVADDGERKDVEVCQGAIGWMEKQGDLEVFNIYETAIADSGLTFYPFPAFGSVYLYDNFDRQTFIALNSYFDRVNEEKQAELQNVARMLGAKHFRLEEYVMEKSVCVVKGKGGVKAKGVPVGADAAKGAAEVNFNEKESQQHEKTVLYEATFQDGSEPQHPDLHWYATDPKIKELVASRFNENDLTPLQHYHFEVSEASTALMYQSIASKVDVALKKMGANVNFSFEGEVQTQSRRRFELDIQF